MLPKNFKLMVHVPPLVLVTIVTSKRLLVMKNYVNTSNVVPTKVSKKMVNVPLIEMVVLELRTNQSGISLILMIIKNAQLRQLKCVLMLMLPKSRLQRLEHVPHIALTT